MSEWHDEVQHEGYRVGPPPTARIKLAALRAAFPDFSIDITAGPGPACFEARRIGGRGSLCTVASTSARELRRILLGRC
jgi:hypothetical protein